MSKIITIEQRGGFDNLVRFLKKSKKPIEESILHKYGRMGVDLLSAHTPVDTGKTAASWYYEIQNDDGVLSLRFCNSNVVDGWCSIAIILQYGHGTGTGGWVEGVDYINPAIQPLFKALAQDLWREVTRA